MTQRTLPINKTLAIDVANLRFSYGANEVLRLQPLQVAVGESMAVVGPSGCGKTTLLHLLAGLIQPTAGQIEIFGQNLSQLPASQLDRFRGQNMGLVFQRFHLLPALTVLQNITIARHLARATRDDSFVAELFERLNLRGLEHHRPSMLSHGQAQRVAIARALIHRPKLLMADEPTSALDDDRAAAALTLLQECAAAAGAALLVVTHDQRIRGQLDSELSLPSPSVQAA